MEELLVPGEWIDPYWSGKCYLGLLPNTGAKDPDAFYLGMKYFEKYYTYFDVNGVQSEGASSLRIGTGVKKMNVQLLQQQYNISSPNYAQNKLDLSQWTFEPNPMTTLPGDGDNAVTKFIKKNMILFIVCCVILGFLLITLIGLCVYLRKKSNGSRISHMFKDKLTYYGKKDTQNNTKVQQMDLSISLDADDSKNQLMMDQGGNNIV